jgi:gamma-glutamyltranspeptidase/glutathione hydrolase
MKKYSCALLLPVLFGAHAFAQAPKMQTCESTPQPAFCGAVRGARAEGWPAQSRSEVMAQHGMVVTSQPLAAQAGLQILQHGGNAIDAAVATAAVLNVTEPMMVGVGGDLFAIVYVAKEHKVYVLNASGMAPTGANVERFNKLGYAWNPKNWGPGSGMPAGGILPVTVPGAVWGWQAVLKRFGKLTFRQVLETAVGYAQNGFPISERIAHDWHLPNALPLQGCCTLQDPDSINMWMARSRCPDRSSRIPSSLKPCEYCRRRGARLSTRARSLKPLSRSRTASAAQ